MKIILNTRLRRAFIAAPLLGAIVFLASIIFIINLSKQESADTARVVSEAYHNRLTSLLEIYRSDVAALFRGSLSQVVESFLSKQCWLNLFLVSNNPSDLEGTICGPKGLKDCDGKDKIDGELTLPELRYYGCKRANQVILDSICAKPPDTICTKPNCDCSKELCTGCEAYEDCIARNSFGLTKWIQYLKDTVIFEGIKYKLANEEQVYDAFINPSNYDDFEDRCKALLKGSIFDCDEFAKENSQCKDGDEVIEGCKEGNFFIKVSLTDSKVYPNLPRIVASDGFGNEIRSGAIGEQEYFYLPINYPLFKYYNYAFEFYSDLENEQSVPSVPKGMCGIGKGDCNSVQAYKDKGYFTGENNPESRIENDFFEKIKKACSKQNNQNENNPNEKRSLQLCIDSDTCGSSELDADAWSKNCNDPEVNMEKLKKGGNSLTADTVEDENLKAAFYTFVKIAARFKDDSPVHQIDPQAPNRFCAYIYQGHVCKQKEDPNGFKHVGDCSQTP